MKLRCAKPEEWDLVSALYRHVSQNTPEMALYGRWIYGKHPTDSMLQKYLQQGALYLLEKGGEAAAAMALTMSQGEDYHDVDWSQNLADDQVAVVHILCVNPDFQKQGLGLKMVDESIRLAKQAGKRAVRLDALAGNLPAHRIYRSKGFVQRGRKKLYAENTGWTDFLFFELLLNEN